MDDKLKKLLNDEVLIKAIDETETENEKLLIMLAVIRNNLILIRDNTKSVRAWVTFFAVLTVISLIIKVIF